MAVKITETTTSASLTTDSKSDAESFAEVLTKSKKKKDYPQPDGQALPHIAYYPIWREISVPARGGRDVVADPSSDKKSGRDAICVGEWALMSGALRQRKTLMAQQKEKVGSNVPSNRDIVSAARGNGVPGASLGSQVERANMTQPQRRLPGSQDNSPLVEVALAQPKRLDKWRNAETVEVVPASSRQALPPPSVSETAVPQQEQRPHRPAMPLAQQTRLQHLQQVARGNSQTPHLDYSFHRWSGEHAVRVSMQDASIQLQPSDTRAADALQRQLESWPRQSPLLLTPEGDRDGQQGRQQQDEQDEEQQ